MNFRLVPVIILILLVFSCVTVPEPRLSGLEDEGQDTLANAEVSQNPDEKPAVPAAALKADSESGDEIKAEPTQGEKAETPEKVSPAAEIIEPINPLSESELLAGIYERMPWNMVAVKDGSRPMVIIHDLDKNGYDDALVVAAEGGEQDFELEELSKSARLFKSGQQYSNFLLLIFYQYGDGLVLRYTVPVSKQLVFSGVEPVEIKRGSDFPYALLFSFRTRAGIERELIILSGYGITRFTIKENLSEISLIEDIDEDGFQDIIVHEQGFEEGTGFETFITWYRWNLREYTAFKTTNIVRNLRQFFLVCSEYMRAGEIAGFLDYAVDPEVLSALRERGVSDQEIVAMIFAPAAAADTEGFFRNGGFSTIVFPEIMETPFSYANRMDFSHQVSVRLGRKGEQSQIFLAELNMQKNPFQEKQFYFSVNIY